MKLPVALLPLCLVLTVDAAIVEETLFAKHAVMNADGTFVRMALFNGTMPGPAIRCNLGDTLKIKVINAMNKEELSVNWQGISQTGTNEMDGVPYVTEVPVSPDGGFRVYEFVADKPGTFHYHSNQEINKMSLHGIIIVDDDPDQDPLAGSYDEELVDSLHGNYPALVSTDWYHHPPEELAAQLDNSIGDWIWAPQSNVVNGFGLYDCRINKETPYYFRCTWQCPADDVECIDEVRCSKARHPFNNGLLGPYVWEEVFSNKLYDTLVASDPTLYTPQVEEAWAVACGWDHIAPFLAGTPNEQVADGRVIGEDGQRHQSQFSNWGRPTGVTCNVTESERDPRCLANGVWPFKGYNKARTYDHLRKEDGFYDVTYFDESDLAKYNATCRATRFFTGDYLPESSHYPFGLWSQSRRDCHEASLADKMAESPAVFEVEAGKTYRLRMVSVATLLYSTLVVEGHSMSVVELDGRYIEPVETNFVDMWNGQAFSVLITANAKPGDYWIGLTSRHRGYTRVDPGRAILRYVTRDANTGETTPVAAPESQLPNDSRPVPKWWDSAPNGQYQGADSSSKPAACPVSSHKTLWDADRDVTSGCPGFYPNNFDQDISMRLEYKYKAREGMYPLPALTDSSASPVMMVQNMNANDAASRENYTACADDYGADDILGTVYNGYSYAGADAWTPRYSRFRPNTDLAGSDPRCGVHRWSVNNVTYPRRYPYSYVSTADGYVQPLLQHVYEGTFDYVPGLVDVKRPDETTYFKSFKWYDSIDPTSLGGNNKELQGVSQASNELLNVMRFPLGEVFDIVMQNTVYLRFWTNAFYGDTHTYRQGSNHHPYHAHGFDFWVLGYGEGNFDAAIWNDQDDIMVDGPGVDYEGGKIHFKNMANPPKRNLAVNFAGGWTVLRINADNAGLWWFHCTVMAHWHMGMGFTLGVGLDTFEGKESPFVATTRACQDCGSSFEISKTCVCTFDPFCCEQEFDQQCKYEAVEACDVPAQCI